MPRPQPARPQVRAARPRTPLSDLDPRPAILEECVTRANVKADARLQRRSTRLQRLTGELARGAREIRQDSSRVLRDDRPRAG